MSTTGEELISTNRRHDVILFDVDGCLVAEHTEILNIPALARVAEYNRIAIEQRDRPEITLCTGRPQPFAECMTRLLGNLDLPIICENGVYLFHPREHRYDMDPAITDDHITAIEDAKHWVLHTFAKDGLTIQPGKEASFSPYHAHPPALDPMIPRIREEAEKRGWPIRVSRSWNYINCDLQHISKRTGIARFFDATGLRHDRAAGVGDTLGDTAIAEAVDWFACPNNADPKLKEHAHFVARQDEILGSLEILEELEQREPQRH
ncbi:HAD hydrolase family protein [Mucisphaera calidilacus]|uniref:Phosphoglycolate phosphatase n=1 Tax=Mucisphaera calidilacus TaxID=2527982 RepID=A0A518BTL3_9BACT|nr:HAD hydrolase family protein [Mucisphaera calidilacus]QDU70313.1 phosphoglycolate phosphatase [Mucisphaera calidilacus]